LIYKNKTLARATLHLFILKCPPFVDEKFHAIRRRFFDCALLEEQEPGVLLTFKEPPSALLDPTTTMTSRAGNGEGPKPKRRAETGNGRRMFFFVQIDALLLPSPRAGLRDDFLLFIFSSSVIRT